ncbi:MAG: hypothetical protein M1813_001867 [Trichoglossum hirsutum]|nr:MAG: hypothetical protein M1813_001867 [Trichoglossum hirsutum]
MTSTVPYPPTQTLSPPSPIPASLALQHVQAYLASALSKPHLHPSSNLTERGPTASLSSSTAGGLVLHNLRRVEAGLRGERWGGEEEEEEEEKEGEREEGDGVGEEGWEDMALYQREQGGGGDGADEGMVGEVPIEVYEGGRTVDKVERKRLKKERSKLENKERMERRRREAAAEKN